MYKRQILFITKPVIKIQKEKTTDVDSDKHLEIQVMSGKHSAYDFNDFKAKAEVCI